MNIALTTLLIFTCYLQIYQVQSLRVRKCYGRPVCGVNGRTYRNACTARRRHVRVRCNGQCPCDACNCPFILSPVCGTDGQTYPNACAARCKHVRVRCNRQCPCDECNCPLNLSPVCGTDGQTYPNACAARCKNVGVRCPWACPCFVIG